MPTHCINFWVAEDDDDDSDDCVDGEDGDDGDDSDEDDDGDDGDEGDKGDDGDDSDEGDGGYNMAILVMQRLLPGPTLRWDHSTKITGVAKDKNLATLQWVVIVSKYQFVSWWQCWCWFWSLTRS